MARTREREREQCVREREFNLWRKSENYAKRERESGFPRERTSSSSTTTMQSNLYTAPACQSPFSLFLFSPKPVSVCERRRLHVLVRNWVKKFSLFSLSFSPENAEQQQKSFSHASPLIFSSLFLLSFSAAASAAATQHRAHNCMPFSVGENVNLNFLTHSLSFSLLFALFSRILLALTCGETLFSSSGGYGAGFFSASAAACSQLYATTMIVSWCRAGFCVASLLPLSHNCALVSSHSRVELM